MNGTCMSSSSKAIDYSSATVQGVKDHHHAKDEDDFGMRRRYYKICRLLDLECVACLD
jgi:hypothetical protein